MTPRLQSLPIKSNPALVAARNHAMRRSGECYEHYDKIKRTAGRRGPAHVIRPFDVEKPQQESRQHPSLNIIGRYLSRRMPAEVQGLLRGKRPMNLHWHNVSEGKAGGSWDTFTAQIAALPMGQPWRHNQAGDLPGDGDAIDAAKLSALVNANRGKLGWTYTHKPMDHMHRNRKAVADANANGFVINLSADTLAEADELAALNIGPVVVVLDAPEGAKADTTTPEGRKVITCPATYRDDVTCCFRLPAMRSREAETIVGFPAHGTYRKAAAAVARG